MHQLNDNVLLTLSVGIPLNLRASKWAAHVKARTIVQVAITLVMHSTSMAQMKTKSRACDWQLEL